MRFQTLVLAAMLGATPVMAADLPVATGGGAFSIRVASLAEQKFATVVRQRYDFSCGSAALATLLSYHYDRTVSEEQAFEAMFSVGDQAAIRRVGFSLLDMKAYLASIGMKADGFRIPLAKVVEARLPAITLIDLQGYKHFVVVKGVRDSRVLVGDPAAGLTLYDVAAFEAIAEGVYFLIRDDVERAQSSFNADDSWAIDRRAPMEMAVRQAGIPFFASLWRNYNEF